MQDIFLSAENRQLVANLFELFRPLSHHDLKLTLLLSIILTEVLAGPFALANCFFITPSPINTT